MRREGRRFRATTLILSGLFLAPQSSAFYLPGVAPTTYKLHDPVPLFVNRLTPGQGEEDHQVRSVISYDYYEEPFHFCKPQPQPQYISESLGSILFGDRIKTSPFELEMGSDTQCKTVPGCGPQRFDASDAKFVNKKIWQNYHLNWLVDGLPAGQMVYEKTTGTKFYSPGFDLGFMDEDKPVLNNHYDIIVDYHKPMQDQYRVVGVIVHPSSNRNAKDIGNGMGDCSQPENLYLNEDGPTNVVFTYSVFWHESDTSFATRWDKYLHVYDPKIHWLSLINSALIVVFLSGMVFVILVRTLRKDITRYNKLDSYVLDDLSQTNGNGHTTSVEDGIQEDSGWKLIHGDVFRTPRRPLLLSILAGNGAQLFMMTGFTIAFALFGFLSPSNRGSLGSVMILLYTLFGGIGGFVSSYTYKCLVNDGEKWKQNVILTPTLLPAIVFGTFFLLDLFLWAKGSSGAVPFTTMLIIVLIWFIISVPLSFAGSWLAFKRPAIEAPVRTNQIPRQIPEPGVATGSGAAMSFLQRPIPSMLLTGILPFGAIFVETHFIMSSLWSTQVYYMFGFLFVCYGLMIVTCATVTVLNVYFVLCAEDYRWQWRSFFTSGACSVYIFLNALLFWASRLSFGGSVSGVLYLGYSALISLLVFVLTGKSRIIRSLARPVTNRTPTGTIGFLASWVFVHRIYRSIKVD